MSINPHINAVTLEPIRLEGEYFILRRKEVEFQIITQYMGKYSGKGFLVLSSTRLIVVVEGKITNNFHSFEFPLNAIYAEEYHEPFFGKNNLTGQIAPVFASTSGNINFTIWFKNPKNGTIINILYTLLDSVRMNNRRIGKDIENALINDEVDSFFAVDINDDSVFYHEQPEALPLPKQVSQSVMYQRGNAPNLINQGQSQINNNNQYSGFGGDNHQNAFMSMMPEQRGNNDLSHFQNNYPYRQPINPQNPFNNQPENNVLISNNNQNEDNPSNIPNMYPNLDENNNFK